MLLIHSDMQWYNHTTCSSYSAVLNEWLAINGLGSRIHLKVKPMNEIK